MHMTLACVRFVRVGESMSCPLDTHVTAISHGPNTDRTRFAATEAINLRSGQPMLKRTACSHEVWPECSNLVDVGAGINPGHARGTEPSDLLLACHAPGKTKVA